MEKSKLYTKYLKEINSMLQNVNKLNVDLKSEITILNDIEIMDIRNVFNKLINNLEDAKRSIDDFSKPQKKAFYSKTKMENLKLYIQMESILMLLVVAHQ